MLCIPDRFGFLACLRAPPSREFRSSLSFRGAYRFLLFLLLPVPGLPLPLPFVLLAFALARAGLAFALVVRARPSTC